MIVWAYTAILHLCRQNHSIKIIYSQKETAKEMPETVQHYISSG